MKFPSIFIHSRPVTPDDDRTFGEMAADWVANGMGSWRFIGLQTIGIVLWISMNVAQVAWVIWHGSPFDPFPYILLNLLFSTQAAYAAPIIMMSQNRQAARDRQTMELILHIVRTIERIAEHIESDEGGIKICVKSIEHDHAQMRADLALLIENLPKHRRRLR